MSEEGQRPRDRFRRESPSGRGWYAQIGGDQARSGVERTTPMPHLDSSLNGNEPSAVMGTPPERRVIRLFPDYGRDWPLWEDSTPTWDVGYATDPQMYGLSEPLTRAIREWNDLWEERFHYDRGWDTNTSREQWRIDGERILRWLRAEVRPFADVEYNPWPLRS